jgi:Tol biopolymer transport system component
MPTFGGDVATVMQRAGDMAWSPDGRHVAFIHRPRPTEPVALVTAAIDGSDSRVLLRGDGAYPFVRGPSWSPDGRTIAVVRSTGGIAAEIWLVPVAGSSARRLSADPPAIFSDEPCFTPDGRGIVHSSNRGGSVNLWFLPVDGGPPTRITTGPGPDESPSVAGDGRVVFASARWRNALVLHQLSTAGSRVLLTHAPYIWAPAFSPDGREIAFSRAEIDGSWHLWGVTIDGSRPRQITASAAGELYPRFTPDGQWLLFHSWNTPHVISRTRRTGLESRVLTTSPGIGDAFADVSPDGRTMVFARSTGRAETLFTASAIGGPAKQLSATPGSVPRWSPDGRHVAFSGDRTFAGGIYVVRADGTGERRLSAMGGWPVWWPDGQRIGFLVVGINGDQEIHVIAASGGKPEKIPGPRYSGTNMPFDVSPDGAAIVTSNAVHVSTELWLLEPAR